MAAARPDVVADPDAQAWNRPPGAGKGGIGKVVDPEALGAVNLSAMLPVSVVVMVSFLFGLELVSLSAGG